MPHPVVLWRLRLFYALYFSLMGLMLPFFPLYLAALDYTPLAIAMMVGVISLARVVAPPLFGHWLDAHPGEKTARRIALAMLLAAAAILLLPYGERWPGLAMTLLLVFSLVWAGVLAPADALTARLGERMGHGFYARIRLWGSVGFIVTSLLAGWLLTDDVLMGLPVLVAILMLLMATGSVPLLAQTPVPGTVANSRQVWPMPLRRLLLAAFLMQCSHGAYYTFYSLHLSSLGYSHQWIGGMWTLGVVAEVIFMALMGRLPRLLPLAVAMQLCFALTALRWLGIAWSEAWWWLVLWQCLHAISFAAFHVLSVNAANRLVSHHHQARTQGWLAAFGFGAGGTVGVMLAGAVAGAVNIAAAFVLSAVIACSGVLLYACFRE